MLGDHPIFTWKNKETQKREQEEYEKWAFPYGETQRANLTARLLEAFPKENVPNTLIPFLTCKELYDGALKRAGSRAGAIDDMLNVQKKYKRIVTVKTMPLYLAFVLADAGIDEKAEYPPVEDIIRQAEELKKLVREE